MKKYLVISFLLSVFAGCGANVQIVSNKDTSYIATLDKVLVESNLADTYIDGELFNSHLMQRLSARGVSVETMSIGKLELNPETRIRAVLSSFKPNQVISLTRTSVTTNGHGIKTKFSATMVIVDIKTKKRIWKSEITHMGNEGQEGAAKFADMIVERLEQDKLVRTLSTQ